MCRVIQGTNNCVSMHRCKWLQVLGLQLSLSVLHWCRFQLLQHRAGKALQSLESIVGALLGIFSGGSAQLRSRREEE